MKAMKRSNNETVYVNKQERRLMWIEWSSLFDLVNKGEKAVKIWLTKSGVKFLVLTLMINNEVFSAH